MNNRKNIKYIPKSMKTVDFSYFSERYLAGEMNEAEKEWFRNELGKNEKLREEITLRQNINSALRNHEVIQLRSKLSAIAKKKAEEEAAKKPRKNRTLTRAAIFTGLILCGSLALLNTKNMTTEEVFERYYTTYDVTTPSRSVQMPAILIIPQLLNISISGITGTLHIFSAKCSAMIRVIWNQ